MQGSCNGALLPARQKLRRQPVRGRFALPHDRHDPPPVSVEEQLETVDPALERGRVRGLVARFVRAEHLRNIGPALRFAGDLALVKAVPLEIRVAARDVLVRRNRQRPESALFRWRDGNQPCARRKQRAETVPVPLLACRAGNHVGWRRQNRLWRRDVRRPRLRRCCRGDRGFLCASRVRRANDGSEQNRKSRTQGSSHEKFLRRDITLLRSALIVEHVRRGPLPADYKLSQKCQEWWKRLSSGANRLLKKSNGSFRG